MLSIRDAFVVAVPTWCKRICFDAEARGGVVDRGIAVHHC